MKAFLASLVTIVIIGAAAKYGLDTYGARMITNTETTSPAVRL